MYARMSSFFFNWLIGDAVICGCGYYVVSGFGFGVISGAFSLVNVLADMTGPGTVGIMGQSSHFFITSGNASVSHWHLCVVMAVKSL